VLKGTFAGVDVPPTQLVDIGGQTVSARVMGRGPTVVLEAGGAGAGLGDTFGGAVERQLAHCATVLTYDRVGSGQSGNKPRETVAEMADDLNVLLEATGCRTPAVIVAWSAGGLVAEMLAVRHPDKVAALILLDPSAAVPDRYLRDTRYSRIRLALEVAASALWFRFIGLLMLLRLPSTRVGRAVVKRTAFKDLSSDKLEQIHRYTANHPRAMLETARIAHLLVPYFKETKSAVQLAQLPDVPMQIITPQPRPRWQLKLVDIDAIHRTFIARFPRGKFVPAHGATHQWLPFERPDIVIDAVREALALTEKDGR
jgi:pimeloyl-ACP methyl ester carboxylesterase